MVQGYLISSWGWKCFQRTPIENAEIDRFQAEVSDREQREYFEMF
jgi:hypothetical protein